MTHDEALARDAACPLAHTRDRFRLPDDLVYLDGNSLGALPRATPAAVAHVVERQWGDDLIAGWNDHGWIGMAQRLGARIAPFVGAQADEVLVCDSTSVNLFKLVAAACLARPGRGTILSEPGNFPTDLYMADGVCAMLGDRRVELVAADALAERIDADTALVLLTHIHYKSARMLDMAALTAAAHAHGALVLWDLSHSVGAVPLDLHASGADMAVGCGYKYLNGGPGAPAFLYVRRDLQDQLRSPLSGWMGHARPFAFDDGYSPGAGIQRFLCGTPSVLAMAALESGLATFDGIDHAALFAKGQRMCAALASGVAARLARFGLDRIGPNDPARRGSHVAFRHPDAWPITRALAARGIVGDFRAPDLLRLGVAPLYTRWVDIARTLDTLEVILRDRAWDQPGFREHLAVT